MKLLVRQFHIPTVDIYVAYLQVILEEVGDDINVLVCRDTLPVLDTGGVPVTFSHPAIDISSKDDDDVVTALNTQRVLQFIKDPVLDAALTTTASASVDYLASTVALAHSSKITLTTILEAIISDFSKHCALVDIKPDLQVIPLEVIEEVPKITLVGV